MCAIAGAQSIAVAAAAPTAAAQPFRYPMCHGTQSAKRTCEKPPGTFGTACPAIAPPTHADPERERARDRDDVLSAARDGLLTTAGNPTSARGLGRGGRRSGQ